MRISLLADGAPNPVLHDALDRLARRHEVDVRDARCLDGLDGLDARPASDVYLLKSRTARAREFAADAERAGAVVINSPAATAAALDRCAMARALHEASVPIPRTWAFPRLSRLTDGDVREALPWPLVVKSRASYRGDLVRVVADPGALEDLLPARAAEPVVAQEFVANDGFDVKVWVIGGDVSAARRRSALDSRDKSSDTRLDVDGLSPQLRHTALRAGAALGLELFGVDLVETPAGPVVVDVNAFPGFRAARDPASSLLRFVERRFSERLVEA